MIEEYNTICERTQYEIFEKKSRFICSLFHVSNEKEANEFIQEIKKTHNNARHNCFAYIVGLDRTIERYSDDGEPSGTAGLPMLEVLRGYELKNVVAIVTRYFGGILLGTGGLVRAYSGSVKECIQNTRVSKKVLYEQIMIDTNYNYLGKIENELHKRNQIIKDVIYTDKIQIIALLRIGENEQIKKNIVEITNGQSKISSKGFNYETK